MITIHHLQRGQSERIVWLCEELDVPYKLKTYQRDPKTLLSPPELQAIHPSKRAPVIEDGDVLLAETGAIMQYILAKYGNGKLSVPPSADNFADYLYYFHFCNGTFQPATLIAARVSKMQLPPDSLDVKLGLGGFQRSLDIVEARLSKSPWLAGEEFTAADIMAVFSLTTMRLFFPYSLEDKKGITAFLKRVSEREGYQRAMARSDPGFTPLTSPEKPEPLRK